MIDPSPEPLTTVRGYTLWATQYDVENAVTTLDCAAARDLTPNLSGTALLDAACGTGRRLPAEGHGGPRRSVGVDLVRDMLRAHRGEARLVNADLRSLPFSRATFDVVWCRLALSHLRDVSAAYREFARVLHREGRVVVTDFHPAAARAGHHRTFRDASGTLHAVDFHAYDANIHTEAARAAGLTVDACRDYRIGPAVRSFYEAAGGLERYQADLDMPLVLGLRFRL